MENIGFVSTRFAGTDGVSLETFKWYQVLQRKGFNCFFFAGKLETPEDISYLEPLAFFDHPEVREVQDECFGRSIRPRWVTDRIGEIKARIKDSLYEFVSGFNIELMIVENALAIPLNIPLGVAITEFISETEIPSIAHHHDFSWERKRFLINAVDDYLKYAFPPTLRSIRHVVINSNASRELSYRKGVSNMIIPNVFDFENPPPAKNYKGRELRERLGFKEDDIFVLQPTRVVPRKWIERSIELVSLMELKRPSLVISHESGDEGDVYVRRIFEYAERFGVQIIYIGDMIGPVRSFNIESGRRYHIDDVYQAADLVSYPSGYEGFGNAFLETIYFKRPIVVNRYSIFVEDIEPLGFEAIAFEGFITRDIIKRIWEMLEPENRERVVNRNYELAKRFFSYSVLEKRLMHLIETFNW